MAGSSSTTYIPIRLCLNTNHQRMISEYQRGKRTSSGCKTHCFESPNISLNGLLKTLSGLESDSDFLNISSRAVKNMNVGRHMIAFKQGCSEDYTYDVTLMGVDRLKYQAYRYTIITGSIDGNSCKLEGLSISKNDLWDHCFAILMTVFMRNGTVHINNDNELFLKID